MSIRGSLLKLFLLNSIRLDSAWNDLGLNDLGVLRSCIGFKARKTIPLPMSIAHVSRVPVETWRCDGIEFRLIKAPTDSEFENVAIGETEVTQELFKAVMGFNPSYYKGIQNDIVFVDIVKKGKEERVPILQNRDFGYDPKKPVEQVSIFDCMDFCNKLSVFFGLRPYYSLENIESYEKSIYKADIKTSKELSFRLPTEDEWYAFALAGTDNKWSGTKNEKELESYAWVNGVYASISDQQTHPVAQKKPNEWGLYDMTGNVWEWCYAEDQSNQHAFLRGGCWNNTAEEVLSTNQNSLPKGSREKESGFRVCRSIG